MIKTLHMYINGASINDKDRNLARLAEYLQNLLNKDYVADIALLDNLSTLPIVQNHDFTPSFDEIEKVSLKDNKAVGPENIHAEVVVASSSHQSPS